MRTLKIRVSEACDTFINVLQSRSGYASAEASLVEGGNVPSSPLKQEKGTFFAGYREYTPSDDSSLIDWKASIRSNKLLIKKFEVLKVLDLIFAFDVSSTMMFGSTDKSKAEYAAELIASLSHTALRLGNNVGLVMFNDKVVGEVNPDSSLGQLTLILNQLTKVEVYGGGFSLVSVLNHLQKTLQHDSLIVLVSDFIGLDKNWQDHIGMLKSNIDMVGIMIRDPMDYSLNFKAEHINLGDPFSNRAVSVDLDTAKTNYERKAREIAHHIESQFRLLNSYFVSLTTDKSFDDALISFGGT